MSQTEKSRNSSISVLFRNLEINAKNPLRLKVSPSRRGRGEEAQGHLF